MKETISQPRLTVVESDKCTFIVKEINESRVTMKDRHLNNMVLLWKGIVRQTGHVQEDYSVTQNTAFPKKTWRHVVFWCQNFTWVMLNVVGNRTETNFFRSFSGARDHPIHAIR